LRSLDQRPDVSIGNVLWPAAQQHGFVGLVDVPGSAVGRGVHGNCLHPQRTNGPDDPSRGLAAIGHQDGFIHKSEP
jgi:hypothetical protein